MDRVRALWVHKSKRDPVSNRHRKIDSKGTEFQPPGFITTRGTLYQVDTGIKDSLWTEVGPYRCKKVKGTPYRTDIGKYTVKGQSFSPLGLITRKGNP